MKKVYTTAGAALLLCGLMITLTFTPGCKTGSNGNPFITDTNTINTVSNYMALAVSEAVSYGMKQDSATTTNVANAVSATIVEFTGGSDLTPGGLTAAFQKLPASILQTQVAGIIITGIESIYQIYWASDVQNAVNGEYAAKSYLGAFVAGIKMGESGQAPVIPLAKMARPVPHVRK